MILDSLNLIEGSINNNLVFTSATQVQRDALTNLEVGEVIYQTDGEIGLYRYTGTEWKFVGVLSADLAKKADLDVDGHLSSLQIPQFNGDVSNTAGSNTISLVNSGVTADTYNKLTVNAKGIVTSASKETTLSGLGLTDAYTKTEVDTALSGKLSSTDSLDATKLINSIDDARLSNKVVLLDSNNKISTSVLPAITMNNVFVLSTANATKNDIATDSVISTDAVKGDVVIVTAESKTYILKDTDATVVTNWEELLSPADGVLSVNGKTGSAITIDANDLAGGTLDAARLPAFTGDATSTAGSSALTLSTTGVTAGTYNNVTVDAKGRVTSASNQSYGSVSASDLTSGTLDAARLPAFTGDATTAAGTSVLTLAASGVTADTYNKVTVNAKGLVTGGTKETTLAGLGLTDAYTKTEVDTALSGKLGTTDSLDATKLINAISDSRLSSKVVLLDSNNKISTSSLPAITMNNVFVLGTVGATKTDLTTDATISTTAVRGDVAIVTAESKTYILKDTTATVEANWEELLSPTGGVISVNGKTGSAVTIDAGDLAGGTLNEARLPAFTGDATSAVGTSALTLSTTGVTAGTYNSVTVDAKGRVTAASTQTYGSTSASDLTSGTLAAARLPVFTGDATTTSGSSVLTLAASGVTADTYNKLTVNAKGLVTGGTKETTLAGLGLTDAYTKAEVNTALSGKLSSTDSLDATKLINAISDSRLSSKVVLLDATNKISTSLLPSITMNNVFVLGTANATKNSIIADSTISTTAVKGDVVVVTAESKTYILKDSSPATLASWIELLSPTGGVLSVNGKTGSAVTIDANDLAGGTLAAARLPAFTGDVTSTAGASALTLSNSGVTAGTYNSVTVDAKGRVTAASTQTYGSTSASDLTSGTLAAARLPAHTGDVTSTAGSAALTLAASGVTAGTYNSVTVDAKGRVTAGTTATYSTTDASLLTAGTLAAGRLPALSGDVTSTAGSASVTVSKINGITVTGTPATDYVLTATSTTAATWKAASGGGVSDTGSTPNTIAKRTSDGSLYATNFYSTSSRELKENINDLIDSDIDLLSPKTFTFKSDEEHQLHFGLIAEEVEAVFPSLVGTNVNGYKSVNYVEIIALLLAKTKQQDAEIQAIKAHLGL